MSDISGDAAGLDKQLTHLSGRLNRVEATLEALAADLEATTRKLDTVSGNLATLGKANWPTLISGAGVLVAVLVGFGAAFSSGWLRDLGRVETTVEQLQERELEAAYSRGFADREREERGDRITSLGASLERDKLLAKQIIEQVEWRLRSERLRELAELRRRLELLENR